MFFAGTTQSAFANELSKSPAPPVGRSVYSVSPVDSASVTGSVRVVYFLTEKGVAPAGVQGDNTDHHHLLVDQDDLPVFNRVMGSCQ